MNRKASYESVMLQRSVKREKKVMITPNVQCGRVNDWTRKGKDQVIRCIGENLHIVVFSFIEFENLSVFLLIPKKGNANECSNYCTIALISHAGKVMLKILQARLQQYMNCEIPDVQAAFRKGRGTRDQIANIRWIIKKAREFQKNIYFCFIDYAITINCGKF